MVKLIKCELKKLKRKRFVSLMAFAAFLFPIPITLLAIAGNAGGADGFDWVFQFVVTYGEALMLPTVIGIIATMLFFTERDNDTLKNLRVIPVSVGKLALAKISVLFILTFVFSATVMIASMLGGVIAGGSINGIIYKFGVAILTGILYTMGTLPLIICIVHFNKSYVLSILMTVFYAFFDFAIGFVFIVSDSPVIKTLINIMPAAIIYRWQMGMFVDKSAAFYDKVNDYFLPLSMTALTLIIIGGVSCVAIVYIYKKRER